MEPIEAVSSSTAGVEFIGRTRNVNVNVNQCQSEIFSVALTAELSRRPRQRRQKAKTE